jgi:hypothetical protein
VNAEARDRELDVCPFCLEPAPVDDPEVATLRVRWSSGLVEEFGVHEICFRESQRPLM